MALSSAARARGAFIVVAEDYTAFASAILSKLLLEIAGETPPARTLAAAALR